MQTSQCFLGNDNSLIESLGLAQKLTVILPALEAVDLGVFTGSGSDLRNLTLKQALDYGTAVSSGHLAYEDSFLIYKNRLVLSLTRDTFFKAGIDAKLSKKYDKYLASFQLPLNNERLEWALENTLTDVYDFLVPSESQKIVENIHTITVPVLTPPNAIGENTEALQDWANETSEWVGLASAGARILDPTYKIDPSLCDFQIDGSVESVKVISISGILTPETIGNFWSQVEKSPWAVINVSGFAHSPEMWGRQHNFLNTAEGGYTLVKADGVTSFKYVAWGDLS